MIVNTPSAVSVSPALTERVCFESAEWRNPFGSLGWDCRECTLDPPLGDPEQGVVACRMGSCVAPAAIQLAPGLELPNHRWRKMTISINNARRGNRVSISCVAGRWCSMQVRRWNYPIPLCLARNGFGAFIGDTNVSEYPTL